MASEQPDPIRLELFYGAVYGLGLSSIIWAGVLFPPPADAATLGLLALAVTLGLLRPRIPFMGRFSTVLPVALAALVLGGVAAGVIAASLTRLVADLCAAHPPGRLHPRQASFRAVAVAMAAFIAGLAYVAVGAPALEPSRALVVGVLLHGVAFQAVYRLLLALAASHGDGVPSPRAQSSMWGIVIACVGSPMLAFPAVAVIRVESLRLGLFATVAAYLVYRLRGSRAARRAGARGARGGRDRSLALQGALTRTLTKAIAGGDRDTENRLWRVQGLCLAVGECLDLDEPTIEALGVAALLRDVGKIGVPETILDKPSGLTTHEMENIRVHPEFGAEMLASIDFPDAVCCIVHHHHERWDGRGYPDGLQGQQIPRGSRILAAVDNYSALISPRPFRRAVSRSDARNHLRREAGKMFDPDVVDVVLRLLDEHADRLPFPAPRVVNATDPLDDAGTVVGVPLQLAQQQLTTLYDLERVTSYSIDLSDCLCLAARRITELIPHRSLVVYELDPDGRRLHVAYAAGQGAEALREVTVAVGERLSGWAVRHRRAIIGHDHSEPLSRDGARSDLEFWLDDPRLAGLGSTMAAPLVVSGQCVGAVTLYDGPERDFSGEDRRRLVEVAGYIAKAVRRGRQVPRSPNHGVTDRLTGLPDGRFLLLDAAERMATSRGVAGELGFLAFQVSRTTEPIAQRSGTELAERGLCEIARRLAEHCRDRETLARFGPDMFVVVSPLSPAENLLDRWNGFIQAVEDQPLEIPGDGPTHARLISAHAGYPEDGGDLQELLSALQGRLRLAADRGATIVPFRSAAGSAR